MLLVLEGRRNIFSDVWCLLGLEYETITPIFVVWYGYGHQASASALMSPKKEEEEEDKTPKYGH